MEDLKKERQLILEKNNIPNNYLDIEYECSKCNDTGYTAEGKRCSCFTNGCATWKNVCSSVPRSLDAPAALRAAPFVRMLKRHPHRRRFDDDVQEHGAMYWQTLNGMNHSV